MGGAHGHLILYLEPLTFCMLTGLKELNCNRDIISVDKSAMSWHDADCHECSLLRGACRSSCKGFFLIQLMLVSS